MAGRPRSTSPGAWSGDVRIDLGPRGHGEVQIDLGELSGADGRPAPPGTPAGRPPSVASRRLPRGPARDWTLAAIVVLVLVGLTGAAVPAPVPAATRVGFVPRTRGDVMFGLDGDLLYAVSPPPATVTRVYRVGDRLVPWPAGQPGDYVARIGDTVLVRSGDLCPDRVDGTIRAVDARTGAIRWTRAPADAGPVAGGYLLLNRAPTGGPCTAPSAVSTPAGRTAPAALAATTLEVVEAATGRTAWTLRARRDPAPSVGPGPDGRPAVLAVGQDGTWTRRDLATGAALGASGVPAMAPTGPPGWAPWTGIPPLPPINVPPGVATWGSAAQMDAGGVLTVSSAIDAFTVGMLDGTTLRPRWTLVVPVPWPVLVVGCGRRVCIWQRTGTLALRADTGQRAWYSPWYVTRRVGAHWAVATTASSTEDPAVLLDLDTGRVVTGLAGWQVAGPFLAPGEFQADAGTDGSPPRPALIYGSERGRTWFARLDPDHGRTQPRVVATAPVELRACAASGRYVACRSGVGTGAVSLWRLPG